MPLCPGVRLTRARHRGLPSGGPGITLAAVTFRALIPLGCGWRWSGSTRPSSFLIRNRFIERLHSCCIWSQVVLPCGKGRVSAGFFPLFSGCRDNDPVSCHPWKATRLANGNALRVGTVSHQLVTPNPIERGFPITRQTVGRR